jgi:glycosyltransferase involved in cell wall biosynthesis
MLMPDRPKVSVIIPTYNRKKKILNAIYSVQKQTFKDWELIISDDASIDGTEQLINKLIIDESRIKLVISKRNLGVAHARNLGANKAKGKYLAFLDSDDKWVPEKLDLQVSFMDSLDETWGASYTGAKVNLINRKKVVESIPKKSGYIFNELLRFNAQIWTPTFMVRSNIYDELGGMDEDFIRHQDLDFFRRVAERYKIAAIPVPLAELFVYTNKRFGIEHIRAKELMYNRYWKKTLEIHGPWISSRIWGREWLVASGCMFRSRNYRLAFSYLLKAIVTNPFQKFEDIARFFLNIIRSMGSLPNVNDA